MSNTTTSNTTFSRSLFLTALPPEIRNGICERVLIHRRPIKIIRGRSEHETRVLLDVCHQLKREFSSLYYNRNVFTCQCLDSDLDRDIEATRSLALWLQRIGVQNRAVLREVQLRFVSRLSFTQVNLLSILRDQNARLAKEVGWLPLSILRVRHADEWIAQDELSELIIKEEKAEEIEALEQTGDSLPKGPNIRMWKRDLSNPMLDLWNKPDDRALADFVCPATWRFHVKAAQEEFWGDLENMRVVEEEQGSSCLSGGLRILVAKMRKGKVAVAKVRFKVRGKSKPVV